MENLKVVVQKPYSFRVEKLTKQLSKDAEIFASCLMPKFKRPKVEAIRSFPKGFTQFDERILQEKVEDSGDELEIASIGCPEVNVVVEDIDDELEIDRFESVESGSTELIDLMHVVDTHKQDVRVDSGACLHLFSELKTREHDMTLRKNCKVFARRDFPQGLKCFEEFVDHKFKDDDFDEHLTADFGSQGDLVDPMVDALSCGDEFEKQEPDMTIQSDVDFEMQEALEDEETIGQMEHGENDDNSYVMVQNDPLVKTAMGDAENFQLNGLCTELVYPCRFPERRKVSAVRDFPRAFKILNAHTEALEENLGHVAADKLAGNNEATYDSRDDVEPFGTEFEPPESSAHTGKGSSCNLRTLSTPHKEDTLKIGAHIGVALDEEATIYQRTSLERNGTAAAKQELANCRADSTAASKRSTTEVTNSNKWIQGKQDSMAAPGCPSMPRQNYQSDINSNRNKGKGEVPKRKQSEGSAPTAVVLALMAPTKCCPT